MDKNFENIKNLNDPEKVNPFAVPENYFEELEDKINAQINIFKLDNKDKNNFSTSENFFDEQADMISKLVKLKNISDEEKEFKTPDNYFETLSSKIEASIKEESNEILSNIPKAHNFEVPELYFEEQLQKIQSQTRGKKEAKVIRPNFAFIYAAAASVLLFIAFNFYIKKEKDICKGDVACLTQSDINQHIENQILNNEIDEETLLENVDVEKLNKSLNLDFNSESKTTNDTLEYLMDNEIDNATIEEI